MVKMTVTDAFWKDDSPSPAQCLRLAVGDAIGLRPRTSQGSNRKMDRSRAPPMLNAPDTPY